MKHPKMSYRALSYSAEQKENSKRPIFIKEPFGLPRELQPTGKFRRDPEKPVYKVTGKFVNSNKNFKAIKTNSLSYANSINLWRGKVSQLQGNGKYKTIKEVWN